MQCHPHAEWADRAPLRGQQGPLGIDRGSDGGRGRGERGLHRITDGLEVDAAVGLDGRVEQGNVTFDRSHHRLAVSLPAVGTPLDVSEEKGDGPRWETGHSHPQIVLSPETTVRYPSHYRRPHGRKGNRPAKRPSLQSGPGRPGAIWLAVRTIVGVVHSRKPEDREDTAVTNSQRTPPEPPPAPLTPKTAKRSAGYRSFAGSNPGDQQ